MKPLSLNESPSEKEGKSHPRTPSLPCSQTLNESPSEKEGKSSKTFTYPVTIVAPQ